MKRNALLNALPAPTLERLNPYLERLPLERGNVLHECGDRIHHVYFPTSGMISLVALDASGATAECGVVGREGIVGGVAALGDGISAFRANVQLAGEAYRLNVDVLRNEFRRDAAVQSMVLRHAQALLAQASQSALCNVAHAVPQRLCRWLLTAHDRADSDHIALTQEFIADMLGVRRPGVTVAAGALQEAGLIRYSRGNITILNRAELERSACGCYRVLRDEYHRLLPAFESKTNDGRVFGNQPYAGRALASARP